ncbi:MAG TPA: hypothetical protein VGO91_07515 [Pyrinomonadaceae bacterium]|jgi:hypothetical protein|nr:hypothetical protein [Pyrinomonadaceae bacterium]
MKHDTQILRQGIICLSLTLGLALCGTLTSVTAQTPQADTSAPAHKSEAKPQPDAGEQKDAKASQQDATQKVSAGGRDPFNKYRIIVKRAVKRVPTPITPPSIQDRIARYKEEKRMAMNMQQPAPKPTTALLLGEMQVIGIFRTPRGYAAMVEATPIKLSYTIYPGEKFYDGQLVAIEEDRLVFRRETRWTDGRLAKAVETKPLRQPSVVADPLAAAAAAKDPAAAGKAEEKAASSDNH